MNTSNIITIVGGSVISCTVAPIAKHPDSGVIVTIEGNPNGFIPTSLLIGERRSAKHSRDGSVWRTCAALDSEVCQAHICAVEQCETRARHTRHACRT